MSKQDDRREVIEEKISNLYGLLRKKKIIEAKIAKTKQEDEEEILEFLKEQDNNTLQIVMSDKTIVPCVVEARANTRVSVDFEVDKIEAKFDKEFCNEVLNKTYEISDIDAMVKLLKKHNVNPKEFKKLLVVKKTVNKQELDQMQQLGFVSLKDLEGCYTIKKTEYVSFKENGRK